MRENRFHCRRCEGQIERSGGARRSFHIPGAKPHYAPDLAVKVEHIAIDAHVEPHEGILRGQVTHRLRSVAPDLRRLKLDQVGIRVEEVRVDGSPVEFSIENHSLWVDLPQSHWGKAAGETFELDVRYEVTRPKRGLYFTGPDSHYPAKRYQVWSQGQDEDNRYWIPSFDYPNQKATSEVRVRVPRGFTAISNGALISKKDEGDLTCFHYRLGTPHVTYLISLVVAELAEITEAGPEGVPVQFFVPPGREEDGKRAFGRTKDMIEAFSGKIGVAYPYEKYSQVAVQDFIFGGMENTSATTQTDKTLHDAKAHLDYSSEPLVSHELAHQWFGDLLTCRDWSHGWLNEGFATFMERVWIESNIAEYGSREAAREEAKYYGLQDLRDYLEEDSGKYRRPIVSNTYIEPIDLFDCHLYQKGGLVLNLIRSVLGEDLFWKAIQLYVARHRGQSVETLDLIRAIEDVTGRNLRRLFDQWVFGAGHPELEVSYQWHKPVDAGKSSRVELVIEQKQTQGKPELREEGVVTPLFQLSVVVELTLEGGKKLRRNIEIGEARERVFFEVDSKPLMIRLDPDGTIPKTLKFPRPKEMLLYQLSHDSDCLGRIEAARELIPEADRVAVQALGKAILSDPFWGVQAEAARALSEIRTDAARDALMAALGISHPKARRAVVRALGRFKGTEVAQAVRPLTEKDPSYFVEAEAVKSWISSWCRPWKMNPEEVSAAEKFILSQMSKESHLDVIRSEALRGIACLPGIGRGERPGMMAELMEWTRRGRPEEARLAAIETLGRIAKSAIPPERARIFELFSTLAEEEGFRIRTRLVLALAGTESMEAVPILEEIREKDADGRVRRSAVVAIHSLRESGSTPESVNQLKSALEKMEEEHRKLKFALEEIRSASGAPRQVQ